MGMARASVVSEVRTLIKFAAAFTVALLALTLWGSPAYAQAELSITKEGPATVEPGEEFVYILTVANEGDAPATGVEVRDRLPEGVEFVEADPTATCLETTDPTTSRDVV